MNEIERFKTLYVVGTHSIFFVRISSGGFKNNTNI